MNSSSPVKRRAKPRSSASLSPFQFKVDSPAKSKHSSPQKRRKTSSRSLVDKQAVLAKFKSDYKVLKTLGEGAEGKVYLARNRLTKEKVAVKIVQDLSYFSKVRQVLREVSILKELSQMEGSQYISKLKQVYWPKDDNESDFIIIVMEYIDGTPLNQFIKMAGSK